MRRRILAGLLGCLALLTLSGAERRAGGVALSCRFQDTEDAAYAYCAVYDGRGKLLALSALDREADSVLIPCESGQAETVKGFLLDSAFRPLCAGARLTVSGGSELPVL